MNRKKRILISSEASYLLSGFGTFTYEILSRLKQLDKYELAEFSQYAYVNDARDTNVKWRLYANGVREDDPRYPLYKSNPFNQFGKWRFDRVVLDFKPDIVCTPPGELVYTKNGYRPIEDIEIGENVLTHTGEFHKVTHTYKKQHEDILKHIYFNGCSETLKLTDNHPVLVYKKRKQTNQKKSIGKIYHDIKPEFVPAKDLKSGDLVVLNPPKLPNINTVDITSYIDNFVSNNNTVQPPNRQSGSQVNRYLKLSKDFGTLCGYIYSDGSISKASISITFNINELKFIQHAQQLFKDIFGLESTFFKCKDKECYTLYCNSVILAEFIQKFLSQFNHNYTYEFLEGIIIGWVRGDGYYANNTVSISTVNKIYAHNLRMIYAILGITSCINKTKFKNPLNSKDTKIYKIDVYGQDAERVHNIVHKKDKIEGTVFNAIRRPKYVQFINGHMVSSIKRIRNVEYNGQVYNLEVEQDNSYTLQQVCVHNCNNKDIWMFQHENESPLRPFFHWCVQPTVDSSPQKPEWLEIYKQADSVFTYTDWNKKVLDKEGNGQINTICDLPSCVNLDTFTPVKNKRLHRHKMMCDPDINLIGTVMRNQKRKLYPDLMNAFVRFLQICKDHNNEELAKNTYLYIHTSYPDVGWNIPQLLKEYGISHKVLFTYICRKCHHHFCSVFKDARTVCPSCNNVAAVMPSVAEGLDRKQLADIYQLMDVYVQYSIAEGEGIPQVEAAACGIPVMSVDHTAMSDVVRKVKGIPLKVKTLFTELETHAHRAMPDNDYAAKKFYEYLTKPKKEKDEHRKKIRQATENYYNWDRITQILERHFDSIQLTGLQGKWDETPPRIKTPDKNIPENLNHTQFVEWLVKNVWQEPNKLNTFEVMSMLRDLNHGATLKNNKLYPFKKEHMIKYVEEQIKNHNDCEKGRCGMEQLTQEDYLVYANMKDELNR